MIADVDVMIVAMLILIGLLLLAFEIALHAMFGVLSGIVFLFLAFKLYDMTGDTVLTFLTAAFGIIVILSAVFGDWS